MKNSGKISLILAVLFFLSACSGDNQGQASNDAVSGRDSGFTRRMPDFGQPDAPADIRGLVSGIVGNEATVLKIERPQADGQDGFNGITENNRPDEEKAQALSLSGNTSGRVPGGVGRGGFGSGARPEADSDMQAQMLERMKTMASGEEKVLIPVGIKMLKRDSESDTKEPTMIEASLEDVKENTMLQIWFNKDVVDRRVAEFVLVLN